MRDSQSLVCRKSSLLPLQHCILADQAKPSVEEGTNSILDVLAVTQELWAALAQAAVRPNLATLTLACQVRFQLTTLPGAL